ncbi:MAG: T9SS type A sorting domain-containing protein [Flavobacteriaceae bacterium]|nr:T9SS type A sorting domain-containing protein [Flavobacteriaceae bacterium]
MFKIIPYYRYVIGAFLVLPLSFLTAQTPLISIKTAGVTHTGGFTTVDEADKTCHDSTNPTPSAEESVTPYISTKTLDNPGHNPVAEAIIDFDNPPRLLQFVLIDPNIILFDMTYKSASQQVDFVSAHSSTSNYTLTLYKDGDTEGIVLTADDPNLDVSGTVNPRFTLSLDPYTAEENGETSFLFGSDYNILQRTSFAGIQESQYFIGEKGDPIVLTASEAAFLGDADGETLTFRQTSTEATSMVTIEANADAVAIGQAIKDAAGDFTIYVQPEVQENGDLHIYADEAFTLEGPFTANITDFAGQRVALYPNPAKSELQLKYAYPTPAQYTIYSLSGQLLGQAQQQDEAVHTIDIAHLSRGTYLLKTTNGTDEKYFHFIKE